MEPTPEASPDNSATLTIAAIVTLAATLVVVVLCITDAIGVASPPHSNARAADGAVTVFAISPGDIYDEAGIEAGDRILSINGTEFETSQSYTDFLRTIRPGERLHIRVLRGETVESFEATARPNLQTSKIIAVAIPVAALLLAGAGVFFAGPRSWTTLLFLLYCASSAVNDACQLPLLGGRSATQLIIISAYTLFSIQSPALGLNVFVLFPARARIQRWLTWWLVPAYLIQTSLGLSYFLPAVSSAWSERVTSLQLHPTLLGLFNSNVVICSALSALSLAAIAIGKNTERVRQQARLLFFGFALLTVLQLALYTLPLRLFGRMLVSAESYMLLDLIVPIFVVAAVLLHRLWNIDLLVRQGFIYGAASVVAATIFTAAVTGLGWFARHIWQDPDIVALVAAAAVAVLLFQPVQRQTRRWVDRHLYRKHFSHPQLIAEIGDQLSTVLDLQAVVILLHTRIAAALDPESLTVVTYRIAPATLEAIESDRPQALGFSGEKAEAAALELRSQRRPFVPEETSMFADFDLVAPILRGEHVLGAMTLGPRRSGIPYLSDDLELLATIARMAAPVMDTARLLEERSDHERLAMVGSATAAIAHELKNPLAAIKSTAAILRRRLKEDHRGQELTDVVVEEVDRLEQSVLEVLTFAKPQKVDPQPVVLVELVSQLIQVVKPDFSRSNITLDFRVGLQPSAFRGDPERLRQALLNLLINASEAMTTGGTVLIDLQRWWTNLGDERGVEIRVVDTGPGFPDAIMGKAFEPFVSGKRLGTGLGLANVKRVATEHGGEVEARNRPGGGAEIILRLPFASDAGPPLILRGENEENQ